MAKAVKTTTSSDKPKAEKAKVSKTPNGLQQKLKPS